MAGEINDALSRQVHDIAESCKPGAFDRLINWITWGSKHAQFANDQQEFHCLDRQSYFQLRQVEQDTRPASHHRPTPVYHQPPLPHAGVGHDGSIHFRQGP